MIQFGSGPLEVACAAFPVGPLETRVAVFRQGTLSVGLVNSDYEIFDQGRQALAEALAVPPENILCAVTNNASRAGGWPEQAQRELRKTAERLPALFRRVTVSYGSNTQDDLTFNRKARRKNGASYVVREEDRRKMSRAKLGAIDPLASVVRFDDETGAPVLLLAHFTGRPVVAYNREAPVIDPDYCGYALLELAKSFHPMQPVTSFLQGCSGDVSAKFLGGGVRKAKEMGRKLGKSFVDAALGEHVVDEPVLGYGAATATLRYAPLPALTELESNGSRGKWTEWALGHVRNGVSSPEKECKLQLHAITFGSEVALVFLQGEPFVGIGLTIRERSPFALTIPVSCTNSMEPHFIGQAKDLGDVDWLSAFYQEALKPPYTKPAGDMLSFKALQLLNEMKGQPART
ncbi:MAG: hypothetical protein JNK48_16740 [Bryobacterales bacterium]|nr:hypothetical protein [Bryobacterales bacterium]